MLFDLNPKERVADLYDRKKELEALSGSLKGERLTVVYGLRRVGKTSLIHAFLNKKEMPYLLIDARKIYQEHASIPKGSLYEYISAEFVDFVEKLGLETEESLTKKYPAIFASESITSLLKGINEWCGDRKLVCVLVFDEAQYLRFGGSVKYDMLLAWSIDNLSNLSYILTGSEVGMLKEFLKYDDVEAPLYGRFRNEIVLGKFDKEMSKDFLARGFEETGKQIASDEINSAVDSIGGIVGWLTYYGYYRGVKGLNHEEALGKVFEEGSRMATKEIEGLISKSRKRYAVALKAIAAGNANWADIKMYVTVKSGVISDTRFSALLQSLVKFGIIEKTREDSYLPADPIIAHAIKNLRP